jgi:DNA polymerase III subunit delta'
VSARAAGQGAPPSLVEATGHQPAARAMLAGALAGEPSHAYLFQGPPGCGKAATARAFAAELLAGASEDPDDTRRRGLADPSPHPDLTWITPRGARQLLVDDVRDHVIRASAYRPFEGGRRIFVLQDADTMNEESQNALLKTLEEPPPFAHLILIASEPERLRETVASRCQIVAFQPLPTEAVRDALTTQGAAGPPAEAAANLSRGDLRRARFLLTDAGEAIRDQAEACARAARAGTVAQMPWRRLLEGAEAAGREASAAVDAELEGELEGLPSGRMVSRVRREGEERAKRALRRERTRALDLGLDLCGLWFRDVAAIASGASDLVLWSDRTSELEADAAGVSPAAVRRACEIVVETRQRLELNVSEELALEALFYRLEEAVGPSPAR